MRNLYLKNWYTPREVAKQGLIKSPRNPDSENSAYFFIIGLIKNGILKARNYSKGTRPYWLVSEDEIKRYHQSVN